MSETWELTEKERHDAWSGGKGTCYIDAVAENIDRVIDAAARKMAEWMIIQMRVSSSLATQRDLDITEQQLAKGGMELWPDPAPTGED